MHQGIVVLRPHRFLALACVASVAGGCATQSDLAVDRVLDARLQTADALGVDPDEVVCRSTDVSGSRIKKVVCGTRDGIEETMRRNQDAFRNIVNGRQAQASGEF